jgi:hypothetical protein
LAGFAAIAGVAAIGAVALTAQKHLEKKGQGYQNGEQMRHRFKFGGCARADKSVLKLR